MYENNTRFQNLDKISYVCYLAESEGILHGNSILCKYVRTVYTIHMIQYLGIYRFISSLIEILFHVFRSREWERCSLSSVDQEDAWAVYLFKNTKGGKRKRGNDYRSISI
jgi:hypothetical protein